MSNRSPAWVTLVPVVGSATGSAKTDLGAIADEIENNIVAKLRRYFITKEPELSFIMTREIEINVILAVTR